jgi:hypothetical protein
MAALKKPPVTLGPPGTVGAALVAAQAQNPKTGNHKGSATVFAPLAPFQRGPNYN